MRHASAVFTSKDVSGEIHHPKNKQRRGLASRLNRLFNRYKAITCERYLSEPQCFGAIAKRLSARGGQVLKAPPGSGKSTLAVMLAKTQRVWVITPTKPLATQYIDKARAAGVECTQLDGNSDKRWDFEAAYRHDQLTALTIQQFVYVHQRGLIAPTDVVLLDELGQAFQWMQNPNWQKPLRYVFDLLAAGEINAMDATPPECLTRALDLEVFTVEPKSRNARTLEIRHIPKGQYSEEHIALAAIHRAQETGTLCILQLKSKALLASLKSHAERLELRCVVATSDTWNTDECQTIRDGQAGDIDVLLCTNILEAGKSLYAPEREAEIRLINRNALPRDFVQFSARLRTFQSLRCYHYISDTRTPKSTSRYETDYRALLADVQAGCQACNATKNLKLEGVELNNYGNVLLADFMRETGGKYDACKATIAHHLEGVHFQHLPADQFATELRKLTNDTVTVAAWEPPETLTTEAHAIKARTKATKEKAIHTVTDALTDTPELAHAGLADLWQGHKAGELLGIFTAKQKAAGRAMLKAAGAGHVQSYFDALRSVLSLLWILAKHHTAGAHTLDLKAALQTLVSLKPTDLTKAQQELSTLALHALPTAELSTKERHRRRHLEGKLTRMDRLAGEWHTLEELQNQFNKYTQKGNALAKAERITSPRKAREILSRYYVLGERRTHNSKRKEYRIERRKTLVDTLQNLGLIAQNSPAQISDYEPNSERTQSVSYGSNTVHSNPYNNTLTE